MQISNADIYDNIGRRDYMEDRCIFGRFNDRYHVAMVFDGHGGCEASEFLKTKLPASFAQAVKDRALECTDIVKVLASLQAEYKRSKRQDGSTLSGVIVDLLSDNVFCVNLGDSQTLIHGAQGKIFYISSRHNASSSGERNEISKKGGVVFYASGSQRVSGILEVTRAFGDFHIDKGLDKYLGRVPDVKKIRITGKSARILIATDGLFDELPADVIARVPMLRNMKAKTLADLVNRYGEKGDNITVMSFQVSAEP